MKKKLRKKNNITLDDLGAMVAIGFEEARLGREEMKADIGQLKEGQEQIKLRLDNVAYRFELVELQRRVKLLEKKAGVRV